MCSICWEYFKSTDEVVVLNCNTKHMFHHKCIEIWVEMGKRKCPLCRTEIAFQDANN